MSLEPTPADSSPSDFGQWVGRRVTPSATPPANRWTQLSQSHAWRKWARMASTSTMTILFPSELSDADRRATLLRFKKARREQHGRSHGHHKSVYASGVQDGAFTSNDRDVRRFAIAKTIRNIDLAADLGAQIYVC